MINRLTDYQFHPASIDEPCECPMCVIHRRKARKAEQSVSELCVTLEWHEQRERDLVAANERLLERSGRLAIESDKRRRDAERLEDNAAKFFLLGLAAFTLSSWWGVIVLGLKLGSWLWSL